MMLSCNQNAFPVSSDGPKNVTVKPLVSVDDLKEGDELKLECSVVESNPLAKQFTWYKNDNMLQQTSDTLTISKVTAGDGGSYCCQADNDINKVKSNKISVSIKCKYCNFNFITNMLK